MLQSELGNIKKMWNKHRIRNSRNAEYLGGRLDVLYFNPAAAGATTEAVIQRCCYEKEDNFAKV